MIAGLPLPDEYHPSNSVPGGLSSEAWGPLMNALAGLLKRVIIKALQPPGGSCLGKGGNMRCLPGFVGATRHSLENQVERRGARPLSLDISKDLTAVIWREGAFLHLRVDPVELSRPAKGLFLGQLPAIQIGIRGC